MVHCVEPIICVDPFVLWLNFKASNSRYHYAKALVLQKRGDVATDHLITEFSLRFKRVEDNGWNDYDSGNR